MAAIGWPARLDYDFKCGGSLISENFVLTAAHCTHYEYVPPVIVRLGDQNIKSTVSDGVQGLDVTIKRIIPHNLHDDRRKVNDIALFELERAVTFTDLIRPACLWQSSHIDNQKVLAAGWGDTVADINVYEPSDELMKVEFNLISNEQCSEIWKRLNYEILDSQMCARDLDGEAKDTCGGDSGGPVMVTKQDNSCLFYIVGKKNFKLSVFPQFVVWIISGVTSFGIKDCGRQGYAGVYTRVSSYLDWIEKIVWT